MKNAQATDKSLIQQLIPANAPSIKDSVFEDEIASKGLRENSNRLNESIT